MKIYQRIVECHAVGIVGRLTAILSLVKNKKVAASMGDKKAQEILKREGVEW